MFSLFSRDLHNPLPRRQEQETSLRNVFPGWVQLLWSPSTASHPQQADARLEARNGSAWLFPAWHKMKLQLSLSCPRTSSSARTWPAVQADHTSLWTHPTSSKGQSRAHSPVWECGSCQVPPGPWLAVSTHTVRAVPDPSPATAGGSCSTCSARGQWGTLAPQNSLLRCPIPP